MPKATSSSSHSPTQAPFQTAHVLKRNQACHQCRRRKLKCDAQRPCSTCIRSHSYAVAHAQPGVQLPPHPDCTFDEVPDTPQAEPVETPKSRFEKLEHRINELESLLQEKDRALKDTNGNQKSPPTATPSPIQAPSVSSMDGTTMFSSPSFSSGDISQLYPPFTPRMDGPNNLDFSQFPNASSLDDLAGVATMLGSTPNSNITPISTSPFVALNGNGIDQSFLSNSQELLFFSWPPNLPDPEVTRHLVEAFFGFHLHATRLFHVPTFMASLDLHPSDPRFPCPAILHCICAIGSMYTARIAPTPQPPDFSTHEVFMGRLRKVHRRPDSFAEQQINHVKRELDIMVDLGSHTFQGVQVCVMLTWFYWSQGRWSESFLYAAQALRISVPCGLNVCPPFHTISEGLRPPSIIPPAKNVIEDETRRNAFWLAYAMERQMGSGNGWALCLDDQDVCQLLPLRGDQFERGTLVYPSERQWSHDKEVLTKHPEQQIDSFILYIKATILLSRVKAFNLRYKGKHYAGDASMQSPASSPANGDQAEYFSVKETPAFRELDDLVTNFKNSFPAQLKNPVDCQVVDPYLYTACLAPNLAQILLHEAHARPGSSSCVHAAKILQAARSIVELMYRITSTSYDISRLGLHAIMCWFMSARVLVRFLKAAIDSKLDEHVVPLQAEIHFVRSMIVKAAEKVFLAERYKRMLDDYLFNTCGQAFADANPKIMTADPCDANPCMYDGSPACETVDMFMQYKAPPVPPQSAQSNGGLAGR